MTASVPPTVPPRRRRGLVPGLIALIALVVIGVVLGAGDLQHPATTSLTGSDIGSEIALGLQAQENSTRPPTVTCPPREPVRSGLRFVCTVGGHPPRPVYVTEVDNRGRVEWSLTP